MSTRPSNPGDPTPPPLNEEHMLEWVEGKLSRIEESNRAAGTRPGVAERVKQMQANRRALQSLGDQRAPAELMDRVMAALERDALLGLTNGQDVSDHPPINIATHQVTVRRNSRLHKWAPQLALAAGLLLLVGGAAYWGSVLIKPKPVGGPIATNTETAPVGDDAATLKEFNRLAAESQPAEVPTAKRGGSDATTIAAVAPAEMTDERVLRLAREGRLLIHVSAGDFSKLAQVEAMDTLKDGRTWRISKNVPPEVVAMVTPAPRPVEASGAEETTIAAVGPMIASNAAGFPLPPTLTFEAQPHTYLVDFPDTQKSLAAIKAMLADRLKAGVRFEELAAPVELPHTQDPESILWWTLPPSSWTQRVTVPVVIESK